MKNYFIFGLVFCICLVPLSSQAEEDQDRCYIKSVKLLKTGAVTTLSAVTDPGDTNTYTYQWHADKGTVENEGRQVQYTAPSLPEGALNTLTASDQQRAAFRQSVKILIYQNK